MEDLKQQLVASAVSYFKNNTNTIKDSMSYEILDTIFSGGLCGDIVHTAGLLLAATVIVHNIPRKDKTLGIWVLRPNGDCYLGLWTFVKANRLEKFCETFSNEEPRLDLRTGKYLPKLVLFNNNYEYLVSGYGRCGADLIDPNTGIKYEVKANYQKNGSVSGVHDAKRLIDCAGTHINIFPVLYDESVDFDNALFRFPKAIPEEILNYFHAITPEMLSLIKSGELISAVEEALAADNFVWNTAV